MKQKFILGAIDLKTLINHEIIIVNALSNKYCNNEMLYFFKYECMLGIIEMKMLRNQQIILFNALSNKYYKKGKF